MNRNLNSFPSTVCSASSWSTRTGGSNPISDLLGCKWWRSSSAGDMGFLFSCCFFLWPSFFHLSLENSSSRLMLKLWRVCPGFPSSVVAIVRKKTSQKHAPRSPDLLFDMHLSSHELLHTFFISSLKKGLLELNLHKKLSH